MESCKAANKILVDADACPVREIITATARKYGIMVTFFVDTSHILEDDYAEVIVIGKGRDAVDFALVNCIRQGDIVVTQDYGLAAMVCAKGAKAIHPVGFIYTPDVLDRLLFERHLSSKIRRSGGRLSGPRKHNHIDYTRFEKALDSLCMNLTAY